jgi:alpha-tubulin suppressor-like RCC1 family protein
MKIAGYVSKNMMRNVAFAGSFMVGYVGLKEYLNSRAETPVEFGIFGGSDESSITAMTRTYIWGNGAYQARPGKHLQFRNFFPKLMETFLGNTNINMTALSFSRDFEAGIDSKGCVYIWPKPVMHSSGEIGKNYNTRENIKQIDSSGKFTQLEFTESFLWGVTKDGKIYQWKLKPLLSSDMDDIQTLESFEIDPPRHVDSLKDIVQIACGFDHFLALNKEGEIFAMGDDTLGQCGIGAKGRHQGGPFYEARIPNPEKIMNLPKIKKICAGKTHSLAVGDFGEFYGWGSNNKMQLSHESEFGKAMDPLLAAFSPLRIEKNLAMINGDNVAAGIDFSVFVGRNRNSDETEVYGCGHNLKGELGVGVLRHVTDVTKNDGLSNMVVKTEEGQKNIRILDIKCGEQHCITNLNIGAVLSWGCNDYGQLGNRKRTFSENPIWMKTFESHNVKNIYAGSTSSAVICENAGDRKKPTKE